MASAGLQFLAKKKWHTKNRDNVERVWAAEKAKEEEEQRIEELRKRLRMEADAEARSKLLTASGLVTKRDGPERIEWMYADHEKVAKESLQESYLLGKPVENLNEVGANLGRVVPDQTREPQGKADSLAKKSGGPPDHGSSSAPRAWSLADVSSNPKLELEARLREDPLLAIKARQAETTVARVRAQQRAETLLGSRGVASAGEPRRTEDKHRGSRHKHHRRHRGGEHSRRRVRGKHHPSEHRSRSRSPTADHSDSSAYSSSSSSPPSHRRRHSSHHGKKTGSQEEEREGAPTTERVAGHKRKRSEELGTGRGERERDGEGRSGRPSKVQAAESVAGTAPASRWGPPATFAVRTGQRMSAEEKAARLAAMRANADVVYGSRFARLESADKEDQTREEASQRARIEDRERAIALARETGGGLRESLQDTPAFVTQLRKKIYTDIRR